MTAWAISSASMINAPASRKNRETALFPLAIPPVNPTHIIWRSGFKMTVSYHINGNRTTSMKLTKPLRFVTLFAMESREKIRRLCENIERSLKGKPEGIRMALVALLARGHLLIEDVPGVGKSTL